MSVDSGQKPSDELDLLVGSTVAGKYHIDRLIGRGGMGAVFQATNAAIGKRVALKFLHAASGRGDAATRFQREAEAASLAESPHIVQIFDSGRSEVGLPFLVMELLTGEDLRARLRREGRLPPSAAVHVATQVLKALKQAHAAGIVHRDLKPDNVFLCQREDEPSFVKLVDFGISKLQQRAGVDTLTHAGAVLGTAFYMSPEQAQSVPDIDGRTDLFSVGAILYEMLTGTPPHRAPSYEAVLIAICTKDAADVRSVVPDVPAALSRVVARALRRDRAERYQSAGEMLADLERSLTARSEAVPKSVSAGRAKPERFRAAVLALVAALGGFAIAAHFVDRAASPSPDAALLASAPARAEPATEATASSPTPAPTARPTSTTPSVPEKTTERVATAKSREATKPRTKPPTPAPTPGVAGGLGLSTREP
jgi:eukaryotic-like serine/threonine-protein kinase